MPLINVKLIEDVFTPEQKRRIVEELTDAMVAIEGESMRQVTWVVVEEVRRDGANSRAGRSGHQKPPNC
jgi:4-oxalocrotonate tautomerase